MSECDKCKHKNELNVYDDEGHLIKSRCEIYKYGKHWFPMRSRECEKCKRFQEYVKSELKKSGVIK